MYVALYVLAVVALLGFGGWFVSNPDWEPGIGIVTSVAGLIALHLNDDGRKAKLKACWTKRQEDTSRALARIKKETGNLQHIAEGKAFKSDAHQQAVECSSLELLERELTPLASYSRYRALVRRMLAEIALVRAAGSKSVARLLPLVEALEVKLKLDLSQTAKKSPNQNAAPDRGGS